MQPNKEDIIKFYSVSDEFETWHGLDIFIISTSLCSSKNSTTKTSLAHGREEMCRRWKESREDVWEKVS